ncbi:DMT family transporter [Deinococcus malanensis]|uniref:DMT family transporter n=1 Tax=Deinococcus malanensis TaxID=1706855 RepID=UPI0036347695
MGLLLFVAFVWGTMFVVVKNLTTVLSTAELMTWRYVLAALPLLPFLRHATSPHLWRHGAVIGVLLFVVVSTQTAGLAFTTANRAAFITGLAVILAPLATAFLARQRVPSAVWIGAVLCLVGLAFLSLEGTPQHRRRTGARHGRELHRLRAVPGKGRSPPRGADLNHHQHPDERPAERRMDVRAGIPRRHPASPAASEHLGALVFVSLIGTVGMYLCQIHGQRRVSPSETVIILSLEPLFTVLASLVFLHEAIGLRGMLGAVLMIGGLLYSQLVPMANARKAGQDT